MEFEKTEFEERRDNPVRKIFKNVKINEYKWVIVLLITIFAGFYYLKVIEIKWFLIVIGGSVFLILLSGFKEGERERMVREDEAKGIVIRELRRKKVEGSTEFGLQEGEVEMIGNCKKYFEDGRPIEWYIGWILRRYDTSEEIPHLATVDVWSGDVNTLSTSLTRFTSDDKPDIRLTIPQEWWDFLDRTKGR